MAKYLTLCVIVAVTCLCVESYLYRAREPSKYSLYTLRKGKTTLILMH